MHRVTIRYAVLVVALTLAGPAWGQDAVSVPAPDPKPYEQVVKLWKAQLSEEFLLRKIEREQVVYRLSTDDIIACKAAGVPESIIEAMMKTGAAVTRRGTVVPPAVEIPQVTPAPRCLCAARRAAGAAVPVPVVAVPPAVLAARSRVRPPGPTVRGTVSFGAAPASSCSGTGGSRGSSPFARTRFAGSTRETKRETSFFRWRRSRSSFSSVRTTPPPTSDCFEWGVKTVDAEFRFRDAGGKREMSSKPLDLFDSLKAIFPNLAAKKYSAKKE